MGALIALICAMGEHSISVSYGKFSRMYDACSFCLPLCNVHATVTAARNKRVGRFYDIVPRRATARNGEPWFEGGQPHSLFVATQAKNERLVMRVFLWGHSRLAAPSVVGHSNVRCPTVAERTNTENHNKFPC